MTHLMLCACVLVFGGAAVAEEPKELANNAALRYWQAIALMPVYTKEQQATLNEFETLDLAKARAVVATAEPPLRLMHRGAAIGPVAWGWDFDKDWPDTPTPQLIEARQLAKLAVVRGCVEFADKKWDEGITDFIDVIRMARHVGKAEMPLSIIVEYSIEDMSVWGLAANLGAMPKEELEKLAAALAAVPPRSTEAEMWRREKRVVNWIRARLDAEGEAGLKKHLFMTNRKEPITQKDLDELEAMFNEVEKIVSLPPSEYDAAARKFDSELHQSTNILVARWIPSLASCRFQEYTTDARSRMLTAAIALLAHGEEAFKAVKDPYGDGPFEKTAVTDGFELRSKAKAYRDEQVMLRVGAK